MAMKRGEIRYFEFSPPDKRRPVLLLARDEGIRHLNDVVVAPITTTIRQLPTHIVLDASDGMPKRCAINLDQIQLVPKHRIGDRIATLGAARMTEVEVATMIALGIRDA